MFVIRQRFFAHPVL